MILVRTSLAPSQSNQSTRDLQNFANLKSESTFRKWDLLKCHYRMWTHRYNALSDQNALNLLQPPVTRHNASSPRHREQLCRERAQPRACTAAAALSQDVWAAAGACALGSSM